MWRSFFALFPVTDIHGDQISGWIMRRKTPTGTEYRRMTEDESVELTSFEAW